MRCIDMNSMLLFASGVTVGGLMIMAGLTPWIVLPAPVFVVVAMVAKKVMDAA